MAFGWLILRLDSSSLQCCVSKIFSMLDVGGHFIGYPGDSESDGVFPAVMKLTG